MNTAEIKSGIDRMSDEELTTDIGGRKADIRYLSSAICHLPSAIRFLLSTFTISAFAKCIAPCGCCWQSVANASAATIRRVF
jgi:hypothetical protein